MWRYSYIAAPNVRLHGSFEHMITIGSFCSIAAWVSIFSYNDHNYRKLTTYPPTAAWIILWESADLWGNVSIWHDVWIGINAVILPWIKIGTGAVIGAGSIVTEDVPPYAIVGWVPAKIIKYRFEPDVIEKLLKSEWWNWEIEKIRKNYNLELLHTENA